MLSIDLAEDVESRLRAVAAATGRSLETLVLDAIVEHLEDVEDLVAAEHELEQVKAGEPTIPLDRVLARHGLAR